jgi:phosphoglycerol transferase
MTKTTPPGGGGRRGLWLMDFPAVFLFFISLALMFSLAWIEREFGQGNMNLTSIIWVVKFPVAEIPDALWLSYLKRVLVILALTAGLAWGLRRLKNSHWGYHFAILLLTGLMLAAALGYADHKLNLAYFLFKQEPTTLFDDYYRRVDSSEVTFASKRNIIILLLESMEETFNDDKLFGKTIIPELRTLRNKNFSAYGYESAEGTNWTAGAMTAFLMGLPLKLPFEWNNYGKMSREFLPGATSIISVLEDHGYRVEFFLGSSAAFGGKGNLFTTHLREPHIYDIDVLAGPDSQPEAGGWGLPDYVLFEKVKDHLAARAKEAPFLTLVQTVDTHGPEGGFFRNRIPAKYHDYRDALAESSYLANDFVRWAKKQKFYKDTTIIILGDHLAMVDQVGSVSLSERPREIYNVFINLPARKGRPRSLRRRFAAFDLAPTILECAGATWADGRFGLGVSLLGQESTLLETKGLDFYNDEYRKYSARYDSFYAGFQK